MLKFVVRTVNLSLVFTENQHLVEFSPIINFLFQVTKGEDFYTHYFIGVLAYVVTSRYFIWKSVIWRLSWWKTSIPWTSLIRVLNHFYKNVYTPNVIVQNVYKRNVFTWPVRVKTFFNFKDKLPKILLAGLVYK